MRRFEAADLKAAILNEDDEDGPWYKLEGGVPIPDENFDPAVKAENERLYAAYIKANSARPYDNSVRDEAYTSWHEHYDTNRAVISETKHVPWTFKWNGKELPVTIVQDNGGTEGGGEAVHMIYKVCDRLFRLDGSYYSYDGTTWDDDSFREVQAVTKAVVFYE